MLIVPFPGGLNFLRISKKLQLGLSYRHIYSSCILGDKNARNCSNDEALSDTKPDIVDEIDEHYSDENVISDEIRVQMSASPEFNEKSDHNVGPHVESPNSSLALITTSETGE